MQLENFPKHLKSSRKICGNGLLLIRFCRRGGHLRKTAKTGNANWLSRKFGKYNYIYGKCTIRNGRTRNDGQEFSAQHRGTGIFGRRLRFGRGKTRTSS